MTPQELRDRTMNFGVRVDALVEPLLAFRTTSNAASQLGEAASSLGANYRAACVARSHAEFRAKIGVALEEADESVYWLEFLHLTKRARGPEWTQILEEARELARILGASVRTSRGSEPPLSPRRRRRRRGRGSERNGE